MYRGFNMKNHIKIIILITVLYTTFVEAQDYIPELPHEKNQLYCLLNVKVETILQENLIMTDSTKVWKKITKNYYNPFGYLIKKEIFDSSLTLPSLITEYMYDDHGNYTEYIRNGSLRERREYNEFGKITHTDYYNFGEITRTRLYKYDSFGNVIEVFTVYSSGKIDTSLITNYNYNYSVSPPVIISDTTYFRERDDLEITTCEFDSIGRINKSLTLHQDKIRNDTTFYYYNVKDLFDSTIHLYGDGITKYLRTYDSYGRLTKIINYSKTSSSPSIWNLSYDDKIFFTIDSLFQKNDLDLTKISKFEKTGVILETLHKDDNEIRVKIITEYYQIGLIKSLIRYDYKFEKIEKKFYEYEFY